MNKKFLIVAGTVVLLFGAGLAVFVSSRKAPFVISPVEEAKPEVKLTTWEDPAGFSFSYPENVKIDPHKEDQENYAHLELTSSGHEGKILIWVKETDYTKTDDWAKREVGEKDQIFETELGGQPAKKVAYSDPAKLVTATIDVDALVLVELYPDEAGFWQEVYDQILANFTFIPSEGEEAIAPGPWEDAGGAGGIIEEPEEVIE